MPAQPLTFAIVKHNNEHPLQLRALCSLRSERFRVVPEQTKTPFLAHPKPKIPFLGFLCFACYAG